MPIGVRGVRLTTTPLSRRSFLTLGALAVGTGTPRLALARPPQPKSREKSLDMYHVHTGEHLKTVYWAEGHYVPESLAQINHLLRDHRADEVRFIDPKLLDLLHALTRKIDARHPLQIMSAYRSPATNARMRKHQRGVAKNSQHIYGKAIDFRVPERRLATVRRAALALRGGGVGYYPRSNFLHIDTGPVRSW